MMAEGMVVLMNTRWHPSEEEVARFIDGACGNTDARRIVEHLRRCEHCRSDFQFAARMCATWETDPESFASHPALVELGMSVAKGALENDAPRRVAGPRHETRRPGRSWALAAAAAGIVLVVAGYWVFQRGAGRPEAGPSAVLATMVKASERFQVVFPRAEDLITTPRHPYRSSTPVIDERVSVELNRLAARHQAGKATRDDLYWLAAGFLSEGQLAPASDVVRHAMALHPDDGEFATMAGLVAYFDGRVEEAERVLRDVVARDPGDAVAVLDLAVVLLERGKKEEATGLLKRVIALRPGTPLAERAAWLSMGDEQERIP